MRLSLGKTRIALLLAMLLAALCESEPAAAHPHVFARIRIDVIVTDGVLTGIRHTWHFDEMFSVFAVSGLGNGKEPPTREALMPLAKRYVDSMKAYGYFTRVTVDGRDAGVSDPSTYALELRNDVLELQFVLPVTGAAAARNVKLSIYDPAYYVALSLAANDAVRIEGEAPNCALAVRASEQPKAVDESFFSSLTSSQNWAAQFATEIDMTCR